MISSLNIKLRCATTLKQKRRRWCASCAIRHVV